MNIILYKSYKIIMNVYIYNKIICQIQFKHMIVSIHKLSAIERLQDVRFDYQY